MVILLLIAVVLIVPVHRRTVPIPARGYAEKVGKVLNRRKRRQRRAHLVPGKEQSSFSLLPFVKKARRSRTREPRAPRVNSARRLRFNLLTDTDYDYVRSPLLRYDRRRGRGGRARVRRTSRKPARCKTRYQVVVNRA